jgi:hypothetical protein
LLDVEGDALPTPPYIYGIHLEEEEASPEDASSDTLKILICHRRYTNT